MPKNIHSVVCSTQMTMFNGFIVHHGMIYGHHNSNLFVSNGIKKYSSNGEEYYNVYLAAKEKDSSNKTIWLKTIVTEFDNQPLFHAIEKSVVYRNEHNIFLHYNNANEIESYRWSKDISHKYFQAHDPYVTPKVKSLPNPKGSAIFNTIKERTVLTQRVNTVKYVYANSTTVI